MLLAGYTVVGEFHYLHHQPGGVPYADANEIGRRLLRAADTAGVRITLLDTCYLHGGFGVAPNTVQRRFSDGTAAAVGRARDVARRRRIAATRVGAAVHSVRAVDPEAIADVAAWASERGVALHAHVSEQPQENTDCLAAHGCTPVELLARHAGLDERFCAVHATHLTSPRSHAARRRRRRVLHLPDHRPRPGRRNRTDGGPRRRATVPRIGLAR